MKVAVNVSGVRRWKTITKVMVAVNVNGVRRWKSVNKIMVAVLVNGVRRWKTLLFGTPTIAQRVEIEQTTSLDYVVTLVGYNYRWNNFNSATYEFQKSINGGVTWTAEDSGTITNPSIGSSNTKTYVLYSITPNVANIFRFSVSAYSSGGGLGTSTSLNTTVQGVRDITNLSGTSSNSSTVSLSWTAPQYALSQQVQYKLNSSSTWTNYGTLGSTANSVIVSGLTHSQTYNFRILPFSGLNLGGYSGNYSNTASVTVQAEQLVCYPQLNCDSTIYTSETQPTTGSEAGSPCYVSSAFTQYKYYQSSNTPSYACDYPHAVSGFSSTCTGCSVYSVVNRTCSPGSTTFTTYWCNSRTVNTTTYPCNGSTQIAYNNVCPTAGSGSGGVCNCQSTTVLSCSSARATASCPAAGSSAGQRCSSCSASTSYSCPSGYGTPYQSGGAWYCQRTSTPYNVIGATATTVNSYTAYENLAVKSYQTRTTSTSTSYVCDTPTVVSGFSASCPGCSVYSTQDSVANCSGSTISTNASGAGCNGCSVSTSTSYYCDSRQYYACNVGPFYTTDNPASYSCSLTTVSTYNYKLYSLSCIGSITYYADSPTDPVCKGCETMVLP